MDLIQRKHRQYRAEAEFQGKKDGQRHDIPYLDSHFNDLTQGIVANYNNLKLEAESANLPELEKSDGRLVIEKFEDKAKALKTKVFEISRDIQVGFSHLAGDTTFPFMFLIGLAGFSIILIGDGIFTATSFKDFSGSFLAAMFLAAGTIISLGLIENWQPRNLSERALKWFERVKFVGIALAIFLIAVGRAEYLEKVLHKQVNMTVMMTAGIICFCGLFLVQKKLINPYLPQLKLWFDGIRSRIRIRRLRRRLRKAELATETHEKQTLEFLRKKQANILWNDKLVEQIENYKLEALAAYKMGYMEVQKTESVKGWHNMLLVLLISLTFGISACHKAMNCHCTETLYDITDSSIDQSHITLASYFPRLSTEDHELFEGYHHVFAPINEFESNRPTTFHVPVSNYYLDDGSILGERYLAEQARLDAHIKNLRQLAHNRPGTAAIAPIIRAANRLGRIECKEKTLYIYSNLRENSNFLNVYSKYGLELVQCKSDSLATLIETTYTVHDLHGVRFSFIHSALSIEDDVGFTAVYKLIKEVLVKHGAEELVE